MKKKNDHVDINLNKNNIMDKIKASPINKLIQSTFQL